MAAPVLVVPALVRMMVAAALGDTLGLVRAAVDLALLPMITAIVDL